jgi:peptidoglycan hydrolase CwlO-like protein
MKTQTKWSPLTVDQWVTWLGATVVAGITITIFFYTNFETKAETQEYKNNQEKYYQILERRLDRIEGKLDQLLTK